MVKPISLTEFILEEERKFPKAKGNFTLLLTQLEYAGKIIASHIRKAGLVDILGKTGRKNVSNDEVIELDRYSNDLLIDTLAASKLVYAVASEEMADFYFLAEENGDYVVFLDPLDGSANTEINITVGTIFSIYKRTDGELLPKGKKQVAAGYILYGTSVMFVYSSGNGVNGFTLDPSIGTFLLSHPNMRIPDRGSIYSLNEANFKDYDEGTKLYLASIKEKGSYKARYIGSMVADVHRTLLKGGIFLYPSDAKYKEGKLRLMFEVNPLSFLITQAGGISETGKGSPLEIQPASLHQRSPVILGSKENVKEYMKYI